VLGFTRRGTAIVELDERLSITAAGAIWLWVTAAADDHRPEAVGTYRSAASAGQLADASRLADALGGAGPEAPADHPFVVLVEGPFGRRRLVPGNAEGDDAAALALLDELTATALEEPLAVATASATLVAGGQGGVAILVSSIGREPVQLRLDPETASVGFERRGGDAEWEPLPRPRVGLVDVSANLLDGLIAPAVIAPGVTGALTVPVSASPDGVSSLALRLGGSIELRGPGWEMGIPTERFVIRSRSAVGA
jgi:hypothetical protein